MSERNRTWSRALLVAAAGALTAAGVMAGRRTPVEAGAGITGRGRPTHPVSRRIREAGFEPEDISARGTALVIASWISMVIVVAGGLLWLLSFYIHQDRADAPHVTAQTGAAVVPPGPRLQADPPRDLAALREHEGEVLNNYASLPGDATHVRVPLGRAMELVVGRSLDPQPDPSAKP